MLIISGKGDMYDYSAADAADAPFRRNEIVSLIVEEGVTSIGKYAFADCTAIAGTELPTTSRCDYNMIIDGVANGLTNVGDVLTAVTAGSY